jgi:hypothetical protein
MPSGTQPEKIYLAGLNKFIDREISNQVEALKAKIAGNQSSARFVKKLGVLHAATD